MKVGLVYGGSLPELGIKTRYAFGFPLCFLLSNDTASFHSTYILMLQ